MEEKMHSVTLEDRKKLCVSCVTEVLSFNESEVVLLLKESKLIVKGSGLKVHEVSSSSGDVVIKGDSVDNITYSKRAVKNAQGVVGRLFK